ncbi:hypothetical protein C8R43DRAFT_1004328 [Mycena crocata]|nr:hypothetical protein C8R43DRAFT_1004328 [Mycena crocata]
MVDADTRIAVARDNHMNLCRTNATTTVRQLEAQLRVMNLSIPKREFYCPMDINIGTGLFSNEILSKIFSWVARDVTWRIPHTASMDAATPSAVCVHHICRLWRKVALRTPIWNRARLRVNDDSYNQTLVQTATLWARAPRANLDVVIAGLGAEPNVNTRSQALCIRDLVLTYSTRFTSLQLQVDAAALHLFMRLPPGSFPALHTLQFLIDHSSKNHPHSEWFVFGPEGDTGLTKMRDLAPRLSGFSLEFPPSLSRRCLCQIDPFEIGLDFEQLTELKLFIEVPLVLAHRMFRSCIVLQKCRLHVGDRDIDDYGMNHAEGNGLTVLPELIHLEIWLPTDVTVSTFFKHLTLPALTHLEFEATGKNTSNLHLSLIDFFRRSHISLSTLRLENITNLSHTALRALLTQQPHLTSLALRWCRGDFLAVFAKWDDERTLLPRLRRLTIEDFCFEPEEDEVDGLARFVDSMCLESNAEREEESEVGNGAGLALVPVCESLTDSSASRILDKVEYWMERMDVRLDEVGR